MSLLPACCRAAVPAESPRDLVKDMVYNSLQDREHQSFWRYRIERTVGRDVRSEEQIETKEGPVYRLLAIDGKPLDPVQTKVEDQRLAELLRNPGAQAAVKRKQDEDEQRLIRLMKLMPDAFLFEYDGEEHDGLIALKFHPNPGFDPPTYEARVFHALAGTIWVDLAQKRMRRLQGQIFERVDFGYGLLGRIEKGGTFEVKRQPVSATHWKTSTLDVHLAGRLIFLKSITKEEHQVRSDFQPVDPNLSLAQAGQLLAPHS